MSRLGQEASDRIDRDLALLTAAAIDAQTVRWQGLYESFSIWQLEQAVRDTRYHLQFLSSALWADEQAIFDEHVEWTRGLFVNLGLPAEWLDGSIMDMRTVVATALPEEQARAAPTIIDGSLSSTRIFLGDSELLAGPGEPYGGLSAYYLSLILGDDPSAVVRSLRDELDAGSSIEDIYLRVIEPAQAELGRLWHLGRLTVGQEHAACGITERAMTEVIAGTRPLRHRKQTLIAACVGEERHSVGLRMVADLFTLDGWNVRYFGASTPAASIVTETERNDADLVALSVSMSHRIKEVAALVSALRANDATAEVPILVGGHPFATISKLATLVGPDGFAPDAATAVELGNRLAAKRNHPVGSTG